MTQGFVRAAIVTTALAAGLAAAGVADLLTVFQAGDPIRAEEVNGNFSALAQRIDDVEARFGPARSIADGRGAECVLGDVWLTANAAVGPAVPADGRILRIDQNSALYSLFGATYGGDGRITFALPDLSHVAPRSANGESLAYVVCTQGIFPSRN